MSWSLQLVNGFDDVKISGPKGKLMKKLNSHIYKTTTLLTW